MEGLCCEKNFKLFYGVCNNNDEFWNRGTKC